MNGGSFDTSYYNINEIIEDIQIVLDNQKEPIETLGYENEPYTPEVQEKLSEVIIQLKKAYIYAKRVDWLFSGDDSEESFLENLKEDLKEFEPKDINWDWVKDEYIKLFKTKNPTKGRFKKEALTRMKALFANNPEYRKDDIIGATKLYLSKTDSNFIMFPHYFIQKGVGIGKTEAILDWLEEYKENEIKTFRNSKKSKLQ